MNKVDQFIESLGPQRLAPLQATECVACHRRVYFQFRSSVASTDPRFRQVYLRCPFCGHAATQLQEIVEKPRVVKVAKPHFKYRA